MTRKGPTAKIDVGNLASHKLGGGAPKRLKDALKLSQPHSADEEDRTPVSRQSEKHSSVLSSSTRRWQMSILRVHCLLEHVTAHDQVDVSCRTGCVK